MEIKAKNYLITRVSNIDNIHDRDVLKSPSSIKFKYYKIVEFCNLESCSRLISSDLLAGVFMPVKFIVYQPLGKKQIFISFLSPISFAYISTQIRLSGGDGTVWVVSECNQHGKWAAFKNVSVAAGGC